MRPSRLPRSRCGFTARTESAVTGSWSFCTGNCRTGRPSRSAPISHSIRALPALSDLRFRPPANAAQTALPSPRLLHPGDGGNLGKTAGHSRGDSEGAEPPAAQVCEVLLDDKDCSWPISRIKVFDGEPSKHALLTADTAKDITGLSSHDMRWCVWSIGADGRISASDVAQIRGIEFKY